MQNHENYIKKTFPDSKHAKFDDAKSDCRDLDMAGLAKASPGGPGGDKSLSAKQAFIFLRN